MLLPKYEVIYKYKLLTFFKLIIMNYLILILTMIKSLKPFMRKYITTTLNIQEFLLVNNVFVSLLIFSIFCYNYFNGYENYTNIRKLDYKQVILLILFSLLTIGSSFIFAKLENNNTVITNTAIKLFSNVMFLVIGFIMFKEKITYKQLLGLSFCGIGIYLTSKN
jgi:uncharacterized membrane protein